MFHSSDWESHLEEAIGRNQELIRPELIESIETLLEDRNTKEKIDRFAKWNVSISINLEDLAVDERFLVESGILARYIATVYFANAVYLGRSVNLKQEIVRVVFGNGHDFDRGRYYVTTEKYVHHITLPKEYLKNLSRLFHGLDAETRHAIHHNIMYDQNNDPVKACERARLVITETVDFGVHIPQPRDTQIVDPFINDFKIAPYINGHNAAEYVCRLLSKDSEKRRLQLYWLARLPIRDQAPCTSNIAELKRELVRFNQSTRLGIPYRRRFVRIKKSPYGINPQLVAILYQQRAVKHDYIEALAEQRRVLQDHLPYIVKQEQGVILQGRRIVRFASQLDYVALKLITQTPESLYAEAKQEELKEKKE